MSSRRTSGHPLLRRLLAFVGGCSLAATVVAVVPDAVGAAGPETWVPAAAPNPPGQPVAMAGPVSCVSTNWCMATGVATLDAPAAYFYFWDGTSWSIRDIAGVPTNGHFDAISCVSESFCAAVGTTQTAHPVAVTAVWNGSTWALTSNPNPGAFFDKLITLSCGSSSFCVAVGTSDDPSVPPHQLVEVWDGATWSLGANADAFIAPWSNAFQSISCTGPGACMAVGFTGDYRQGPQPVVASFDGTSWTQLPAAQPGVASGLHAVSCVSASACVAVGHVQLTWSSPPVPLAEYWDGSAWTPEVINTPGAVDGTPFGISCASMDYCVAAGLVPSGDNFHTFLEEYSGGTWSFPPAPNPGAVDDRLLGVSCPAVQACVAGGWTRDLNKYWHPLFASNYQPAASTTSPALTLTQPPSITVQATAQNAGLATWTMPTAMLDGNPDPNAVVACSAGGSTGQAGFPLGTTTVTCEGDDLAAAYGPASVQFTVTVVPGPTVRIELLPDDATITLGQSQSFTAIGFDQYTNSTGDVTSTTTFTGPGCDGATCTPTAPGVYTITATNNGFTATTTLTVNKIPVPVTVRGEVVNHNQVLFSASVTLPDNSVHVLQGIDCTTLEDGDQGTILKQSLAFGTYPLVPFFCTADPIVSDTYAAKITAATVTSAKFGVTSATVANGRVGAFYSSSLTAAGGTTANTWSLVSGTLPPGVKLTSGGQLSGTPTHAGTYPFTVQVRSGSQSITWPYAITISSTSVVPLSINSAWLKPAYLGKSYSFTLQGAGGKGTRHWSVPAGDLPAGLKMSSAGAITGTPTGDGRQFTVTLSDSATPPTQVTRVFTLPVNPITITPSGTLKPGKVKTYYSVTFHADSGVTPLRWGYSGTLPPGLKMSSGGVLSGTPTTAGTWGFAAVVVDAKGNDASELVYLTINP